MPQPHVHSGSRHSGRTLARVVTAFAAFACSSLPAFADPPVYGNPNGTGTLAPPLTAPPIGAPSLGTGPADVATPAPQTDGAAPAYDPATSYAAQSATYTLRPGDLVSINVFGQPSFSESAARILPDGSVAMPLIGSVRIVGLTPTRAASAIDVALKHYLRQPQSTVSVLQVAPVSVLVLGAVRAPSKYSLGPQSRLMDAIAAAGGLAPIDGDLPDARIESGTATISSVSLQKLFVGGDLSLNRPIENGMTIYVPSPNTFQVQVFGAVDHSGDVTVREGDRLSMAVARAGVSSNSNSDLNNVFFKRNNPDGTVTKETINLYKVLQQSDVAADPVLRKNDLIQIPKARSAQSSGILSVFYALSGIARF